MTCIKSTLPEIQSSSPPGETTTTSPPVIQKVIAIRASPSSGVLKMTVDLFLLIFFYFSFFHLCKPVKICHTKSQHRTCCLRQMGNVFARACQLILYSYVECNIQHYYVIRYTMYIIYRTTYN